MTRNVGKLTTGILVGVLLTTPLAAEGQEKGKVYRVGVLTRQPEAWPSFGAFGHALRDRGYIEGQNLSLVWRFAGMDPERLRHFAEDLVRRRVDVIVTVTNPATLAVKRATSGIPIVCVGCIDFVGGGLAASIAKPGGNITGLSLDVTLEVGTKRLQLLVEAAPNSSRVAV